MKSLLILISTFSVLVAQVRFSPVIYMDYLSTGSDFQPSSNEIKVFGAGLKIVYETEKLNILAKFVNHRLYGTSSQNNLHNFNSHAGFSWGQDPTRTGDSFDYDFADLDIRYKLTNGELFYGKMNPQWGVGKSKLIISDKSPSFPLFGFNWQVNDKVSMEYFHGELKSSIQDESGLNYYTDDLGKVKLSDISRNIAAHRFIWSPVENLSFVGTETVIYGVRGIDSHYLIPFIPFWSLQHYLGDTDNIQMSGELIYSPSNRLNFYATIFMDEWAPEKTFSEDDRNWFAYQSGLTYVELFNNSDELRLEFTWTDSRIYHHRFEVNDYYSHGYPLGFWGGPHAEEFYFSYSLEMMNVDWSLNISNAKRGEYTSLEIQYDNDIDDVKRFEGVVENKLFIELEVEKPIYEELFVNAGISYINWSNAGFDPSGGDGQELEDISKTSFSVGLNYNY